MCKLKVLKLLGTRRLLGAAGIATRSDRTLRSGLLALLLGARTLYAELLASILRISQHSEHPHSASVLKLANPAACIGRMDGSPGALL